MSRTEECEKVTGIPEVMRAYRKGNSLISEPTLLTNPPFVLKFDSIMSDMIENNIGKAASWDQDCGSSG